MDTDHQKPPIGFEIDPVLCPDSYQSLIRKRVEYIQSLEQWKAEDVEELIRYNLHRFDQFEEGGIPVKLLASIAFDTRCPDEVSERYQRILNEPTTYLLPTHIKI